MSAFVHHSTHILATRLFPCRLPTSSHPCRMRFEPQPSPDQKAFVFQTSPYRTDRIRRRANLRQVSSTPVSDVQSPSDLSSSVPKSDAASRQSSQSDVKPPVDNFSPPSFSTHEQLVDAFNAMAGDPLESDGGRIVVYRGDPNARLMIIGEAPGENEDQQGRPFVGKAGKLLDDIFRYGGFDIERQIYVTNVAKRRPKNNRTPTPEEVSYYLPHLMEEIRLVDPVIVVLAGRVAAQAFLGADARITKVRGQWFDNLLTGRQIMPVFHPSYLLRQQNAKYDMVTDIEEIRAQFQRLVPEQPLNDLVRKRKS